MGLFDRKKKNDALEAALNRVRVNMANNYKDAAQADFKAFTALFAELKENGKLSERQLSVYEPIKEDLTEKLNKYTHADQKTAWTKEDLT